MFLSFAIMLILGTVAANIFNYFKLPKIIGYILVGIIASPTLLNLFDPKLLNISLEIRQIALIIILLRAGLSLNLKDLIKVGRPAILLSFLPATFEIIAYIFLAHFFFNLSFIEAGIMGCVLSAVSPAIVVPKMLFLMENKYGTKKSIPQMILAGSSCDDIYVIVLLSIFIGFEQGLGFNIISLVTFPFLIILSCLFGLIIGSLLAYLLKYLDYLNNTYQLMILFGIAFLINGLEPIIKNYIPISGILIIVVMACVFKLKSKHDLVLNFNHKLSHIWLWAELALFVLVGSAIDLNYVQTVGLVGIVIILLALIIRSMGVFISLVKTKLNYKERLFCILAYLPKATVQAAIGSLPLSLNLACGKIVLSVAVLGILISAPLGALSIDYTYQKLLNDD